MVQETSSPFFPYSLTSSPLPSSSFFLPPPSFFLLLPSSSFFLPPSLLPPLSSPLSPFLPLSSSPLPPSSSPLPSSLPSLIPLPLFFPLSSSLPPFSFFLPPFSLPPPPQKIYLLSNQLFSRAKELAASGECEQGRIEEESKTLEEAVHTFAARLDERREIILHSFEYYQKVDTVSNEWWLPWRLNIAGFCFC